MAEQEDGKAFRFIPKDGPEGKSSRDYYGRGTAFYPNDEIYEGDYKNGIRNGKGIYTYVVPEQPSNKYEGDFKDNKKHGIGQVTYTQRGETYYGQWENGKKHGEGIYTYKNKDTYSGWWAFGKKQGQGTYIFSSTGQRLIGRWENNQLVEGRWILPNGTYYEGKFANNKPDGQGTWYFTSKNECSGNYKQQKVDNEEDPDAPPDWKLTWQSEAKLFQSAKLINDHLNF